MLSWVIRGRHFHSEGCGALWLSVHSVIINIKCIEKFEKPAEEVGFHKVRWVRKDMRLERGPE